MATSPLLREDILHSVENPGVPWEELRNATIMVTGATGLIGSIIVRILSEAGRRHSLSCTVVAVGRNRERGEELAGLAGVEFLQADIRQPLTLAGGVDFIIHGAAVTRSAEMAANPVGVIDTSLAGTNAILMLAQEKRVRSMVYLSSMEVYGETDPGCAVITEDDLGYVDPLRPRSCYPESKRMCECMCACWHAQFGLPVKIARLAQTFGAGTPPDDPRVFGQFARSAMAGTDIVLHTEGRSRGNYCYLSDAVVGILVILLRGRDGEAYNVANSSASMTIREMAELVARTLGNGGTRVTVKLPVDARVLGYAPDVCTRLSAEKLENLGWSPRFGLADMYRRMTEYWV